jgi:hypothetical protein
MLVMAVNPVQLGERHVIGPDTRILGGVYYRHGANVVDFNEAPRPYEVAYEHLEEYLTGGEEETLLAFGYALNWAVNDTMVSDRHLTGAVLRQEALRRGQLVIGDGDEIGLSRFMNAAAGVCRHQALLGGALVELLQARRDTGIRASLELPQIPGLNPHHAWLRCTRDDDGVVVDFDQRKVIPVKSLPSALDYYYSQVESPVAA